MTIRLYVDEDAMDKNFVQALRARGVDVLTAWEANMIERTDEEHLHYATAQNRVLYTFNVGDFYRLHIHKPLKEIPFPEEGIYRRDHGDHRVKKQKNYAFKKSNLRALCGLSGENVCSSLPVVLFEIVRL